MNVCRLVNGDNQHPVAIFTRNSTWNTICRPLTRRHTFIHHDCGEKIGGVARPGTAGDPEDPISAERLASCGNGTPQARDSRVTSGTSSLPTINLGGNPQH